MSEGLGTSNPTAKTLACASEIAAEDAVTKHEFKMTQYVQALYDFITSEPGEISLRVGDVVQVIHQVDDNWLYGSLYGQKGNFPAGFVQGLALPRIQTGQKVFVATRSFLAEVQGDLELRKGDLIVGLKPVDSNWWEGQKAGQTGIFPSTHVYELHVAGNNISADLQQPSHALQNDSQYVATDKSKEVPYEAPAPAVLAKGRANMDLSAQLDDELELHVGDVISITEVVDEDFAVGECDGRTGQFPLAFVDIFEGEVKLPQRSRTDSMPKYDWWKKEALELADEVEDMVNSVFSHEVSNIEADSDIPKYAVAETVSTSESHTEHKSNDISDMHNTSSISYYDSEVTPYGKTLFAFVAENPNELSFPANEIINLYRHIDDQWTEGDYNGKRGIFPTSFLEILVDCPRVDPARRQSEQLDVKDTSNTEVKPVDVSFGEEVYGRVLYDFKAESQKDLEMKEGDTVTILRRIDDNWFEARHDDGHTGLCPVSFVEVIGSEPSSVTASDINASEKVAKEVPVDVVPNSSAAESSSVESVNPESSSGREHKVSVTDDTAIVSSSCPINETVPSEAPLPSAQTASPTPVNGESLPPSKPVIDKPSIKPRAPMKPRPTPKPKPAVANKPRAGMKPAVVPRRQATMDNQNSRQDGAAEGRLQKAMSLDASLDDIIVSQMRISSQPNNKARPMSMAEGMLETSRAQQNVMEQSWSPMSSSVVGCILEGDESHASNQSIPELVRQDSSQPRPVPTRPPPPPPSATSPPTRPTSRPAPTRPTGPCMAPAPSKAPLVPAPHSGDPRPVPSRPAPARPGLTPPNRPPSFRRKKRSPGDLMDFSPETSVMDDDEPENNEVIQDLERRIADVQADLQKYTESKKNLEKSVGDLGDEADSEAQENLEFYGANIKGLTEELEQLKASLYELQPKRAAAEAAIKKRAEDAKIRRQQEIHRRKEERERHREQRQKVIEEIVKTEQDFLQGMHLCIEVFLSPEVEQCALVDIESLFGNIDEVVEVSQRLLTLLEGSISGKVFQEQIVGQPFVELKEDLKKVYAPYCRNHDDVILMLEKFGDNPEIQEYINGRLDAMRQHSTVFDLGSVLIKPVQRIMKYPLLINELIKVTEDDHPDKVHLLAAINAMTDVATAINEYKRRKDLVLKYRQNTDEKLTDKIARLSMHSTKKKLIRATWRIYGPQTVDEEFNREERKFVNLEKGVRTFVRDVGVYLEYLQESAGCQETVANDISDYYAEKAGDPEVEQFCNVHNQLATNLLRNFRMEVENEVLLPLNKLLAMFQGPNKVIKKRHDKLLDYDNLASKVASTRNEAQLKSYKDLEQKAKNNYEAMNAQLLDELPKLYSLSMEIVRECMNKMIMSQREYLNQAIEEIYQLLGLQLVLDVGETNIIETFNIAHTAIVEKMSNMSFISKAMNPRAEERRAHRKSRASLEKMPLEATVSGPQSESQQLYLRQLYNADRLFRVSEDHTDGQMMGLSVKRGVMVGVMKEGDPMGNKERWFVDTGSTKGFLPKKVLVPVRASMGPEEMAPDLVDLSSPQKPPLAADFNTVLQPTSVWYPASETSTEATATDGIRWSSVTGGEYASVEDAFMEPEPVISCQPDSEKVPLGSADTVVCAQQAEPPPQYYQAVYPFTARTDLEVSLQQGDIVRVINKQDLDGNQEWWHVDINGQQGYAPSNYLYQVR